MKKKDGKRKSKLSEEEKREQVAAALKRKRDCEKKAVEIVARLSEESVSKDCLLQYLSHINQDYYDDILTERSIDKLCGYPLCPNKIDNKIKSKFHISLKEKKVYDTEERSKFCSGFCFKASHHLKGQLDSSPLWLREHKTLSDIDLLVSANTSKIGKVFDKGEEVEILVQAKPPPDDKTNDEKQVVILHNLDTDAEIRITDAQSGDNLYSTQQNDDQDKKALNESGKPKSILKKSNSSEKLDNTKQGSSVSFNSEYTGLSEVVTEHKNDNTAEHVLEHNLESASAAQLLAAMKEIQQQNNKPADQTLNAVKVKLKKEKEKKVEVSEVMEVSTADRVASILSEWLTPETIDILKGNKEGVPDGEEETETQDMNLIIKKAQSIHLNTKSEFEVDPEVVAETDVFTRKYESFMKGKDTWEPPNIEEKEDGSDDDGPSLPLLDKHSQLQHRRLIVLDQLNRYASPIYEMLGLQKRSIEAELKILTRTMKLTAESIALQPVEWRVLSIFIIHLLVDRILHNKLSSSKQFQISFNILLQEFSLTSQMLNKFKDEIFCDKSVIST